MYHAFCPPWCCLVVRFDNIERRVGVYMPLRAPTVAAEEDRKVSLVSNQGDAMTMHSHKDTKLHYSRLDQKNVCQLAC